MKKEIGDLVLEKGFYNEPEDIPKKLLFAFIELGEASDDWKKGKGEEEMAEELIDVIFYVLDASRLDVRQSAWMRCSRRNWRRTKLENISMVKDTGRSEVA